ncbi:MAG: hypothetical protein JW954_05665 [Dehalococcoidaceae bacterium]|nr:hypothetical protein [Dehalococcoidaceae bacterium]
MERTTRYTNSHKLIIEALEIPLEKYPGLISRMKDRDLYLLMGELDHACRYIQDAVANTAKFEVKPSPAEFQDSEKIAPVIELMQKELERRAGQKQQP